MDSRLKQNILKAAVAKPRNPLLRSQKRLGAHRRFHRSKQFFKVPFIKFLCQRRNALDTLSVILVIIIARMAGNTAIHGHCKSNRGPIRKFQEKLVFLRPDLFLPDKSGIYSVIKPQPDAAVEFQFRKDTKTGRARHRMTGQKRLVLLRFMVKPAEFVG